MTIITAYVPISYAGNNVTNSFALTFDYQESSQIVANTEVVATGVITPLVYGTDFTITPTVNSPASFGTLTLLLGALPSGTNILITRVTDVTQDTSWINNSANPASAFENAVDKLTMIDQEILQGGGTLPDSALGSGTATTDTFLRGGSPRTWSNTLVGPLGAFTVPADTASLLNVGQSADTAMRLIGGASSVSAYRFAVDGDTNAWAMELVYDPGIPGVGFRAFGGSNFATFLNSGDVDFTGTVNANLYTGNAAGSLITSGQVLPQFLASNAAGNASTFLNGLGLFAVPAGGGGGINTTTTAPFTIPAVNSSNTVNVADATGIVAGTYLQISDGTHTINGLVTNVASLALTVKTNDIILGSVGNTMASGAAVQGAQAQIGTINIADGSMGPLSMTTLQLDGSAAAHATGAGGVFLYINNVVGSTITAHGYVVKGAVSSTAIANAFTGAGVTGIPTRLAANGDIILPTAQGQVLSCSSFSGGLSQTIGWGLIGPSNITSGSLTPILLNATNSLTNGYVPSYDSGTGHFTWVANGGSIPGGGTTANFFRGDNTFTNSLAGPINIDLSSSTTFRIGVANVFGGTTPVQAYMEPVVSGTPTVLPLQIASQVALGGTQYNTIDTTNVIETLQVNAIARATSFRSTCGPWLEIYELGVGGGATAIDLVNGSYQRFTSLGSNITVTLADTSPLPNARRFSSELTLEFNAMSTFDVTWPGTITWANGGVAPTVANGAMHAAGINVIRLVRRQGQTQWVGYIENPPATGSGTVTSVATGAGLTGGPITTTGTIAVATGGITASLIANNTITSAQISASANIPTTALALPGGTTTFLAANGTWLVPPGTGGGGGGGPTLAGTQTWTGVNTYTNGLVTTGANTFTTALNTFSRTFGSLSSSTASVKMCGLYPQIAMADASGIEIAINDTFDNDFGGLGDVGVGAFSIKHTCTSTSGNNGKASTRFDFILNQTLDTLFSIGHSQITASKRLNGGIADSVWLNSWGPDSNYSATPDSNGTTHEFNSGFVRIGECNYGNAWGDFGFLADRNGPNPIVCGLEFTPDWLVYDGVAADTAFVKYNTTYAISITGAAQNPAQPTHHDARNWIGLLISTGAIVGSTDHASVIGPGTTGSTAGGGGYGIQLHGNPTGNPIGKAINILDYMDVGIDISGATITAELISGHTNKPAIQLLSGQAICFKAPTGANTGVYIWFNGTNLVATKDGGNTTATII